MKRLLSCCLASTMALSLLGTCALATEQIELPPEIPQEIQQETLTTDYQEGYFQFTQIIEAQYEDGGVMSSIEKMAPVKLGGKWGYINSQNEVIVPFEYDFASGFTEGKAIVGVSAGSSKYTFGFVDTMGNYTPIMVQDMEFSTGFAQPTGTYSPLVGSTYGNSGFAIFYNGINTNLCYTDSRSSMGGHMGLIVDATTAIATVVEGYQLNFYNEGVITANSVKGTNARALDKNGNLIWDMGAYTAYALNKGHIVCKNTSGKWGLMNYSTRDWQLEPIYNEVGMSWADGAATAISETNLVSVKNTSGKYGAVDLNGNTVIPFTYTRLYRSIEGVTLFHNGSSYGYLDSTTNQVIHGTTYSLATTFNKGMAVVKKSGSSYLIGKTGEKITGSEVLDASIYFANNALLNPDEYLTTSSGGKVGYGQILFQPELPTEDDMSLWALDKVVAAIKSDLVPANQQNLYTTNVTRQDFAQLAIIALAERYNMDHDTFVKAKTGKTMEEWVNTYPFNDTNNQYVAAAYAIGIVSGKGEGRFDPYAYITREEVAVVMSSMSEAVNSGYEAPAYAFSDRDSISEWAIKQVDYAAAEHIMSTTGNEAFSPSDNCTREQSFIILYNFFNQK